MDKNTIKLLNEDFAREVKSMITRSDLSEDAKSIKSISIKSIKMSSAKM